MSNKAQGERLTPDRVEMTRDAVSGYMERILRYFKPNAKITVIIRTPGNDNADMVLTNDTLEQAVSVLARQGLKDGKDGR